MNSPRRVSRAAKAHLKLIPMHTRNVCFAGDHRGTMDPFQDCGIDYEAGKDLPGMWRWLLAQPSFSQSNGSDHFIVIDPPYTHLQTRVR